MSKKKKFNYGHLLKGVKKVSVSRKRREGPYRFERYKVDRYSDIGGVSVGCYLNGEMHMDMGSFQRNIYTHWNRVIDKSSIIDSDELKLIFVIDARDSVIRGSGYCLFDCQFTLETGRDVDELIYDGRMYS